MPAAPATQPSPNIGMRLMFGDNPIRLIKRASIEGLAIPVTDVAEFERHADPMIVGLSPASQFGIRIYGQREKTTVNAHVAMQSLQHPQLRQPVTPVPLESRKQHLLRIVMFWKRGGGAKNLHGGWIQVSG